MATATILVVDDEQAHRFLLRQYLVREGYRVLEAEDGERALAALRDGEVDLALVDIMMPGIDGLELVRLIRAESRIPVILVTARGEESSRVAGLEVGADDYVVKPYSLPEVVARVRARLRRAREDQNHEPADIEMLRSGAIELNRNTRQCTVSGRPVDLTRREFDLLATLMERPGVVLSRQQLLERAWETIHLSEKTVDVHMAKLRQKLGDDLRVSAVRGVGYRLER